MPHLIVERDGPVLIATMNRPERMNALSPEMFAQMYDAWQEAWRRTRSAASY